MKQIIKAVEEAMSLSINAHAECRMNQIPIFKLEQLTQQLAKIIFLVKDLPDTGT